MIAVLSKARRRDELELGESSKILEKSSEAKLKEAAEDNSTAFRVTFRKQNALLRFVECVSALHCSTTL